MRKSLPVAFVGLLLMSLMMGLFSAFAEGTESGVFPNRTFFVTRSLPGGPRTDTFTVGIQPTQTGHWWVTAESIAGSAVIVEVWSDDAGILTLESSSKLRAVGEQSTKTLLVAGQVYRASFTPFGRSGTSSLREHFVVPAPPPPSGEIVWIRQFGSTADDTAWAVAADASGIYVVGSTSGTLPGQTSSGEGEDKAVVIDAYLRKYGVEGNEIWTRQFGSSSGTFAVEVAVGATGVYVVGDTFGALPGQANGGGVDAFVRKYDFDGSEVWTRQFGSLSDELAHEVAADASGVYVAGLTSGILPDQMAAGNLDVFVRKYDSDGNEVWTRQFGSPEDDSPGGIAVGASGVYVAGLTQGALLGQTSLGGSDAFLRKYDLEGSEIWMRQFGSSGDESIEAATVDPSGVYVVGIASGLFQGQVSFVSFIAKFDVNGNEIWMREFGSSPVEWAFGVAAGASGVYVAGLMFVISPTEKHIDVFARKYDGDGNEVWRLQFGSSADDSAHGIAVDTSGVYTAGFTGGTLPGQTSAGYADAFAAKLVL